MNNEKLEQIHNYFPIDDHVATAGQPTIDQFKTIKQAKFDLVINLALADSPNALTDEGELIRQLEMDYIHIPVDFKAPTLNDLDTFFSVIDQHQNKRIFVHCALNWRVSAFIFLYKRIRQHVPSCDAISAMHAVWKPDDTWQRFIESALAHYQIQD